MAGTLKAPEGERASIAFAREKDGKLVISHESLPREEVQLQPLARA